MDAREDLIQQIFEEMTMIKRTMASQHGRPSELNIPLAQGKLLYIVSQREGLSIKEIAEVMQVTGSAVTQLVELLVKADLLVRESDPNDRRILRISLSPEGFKKLKELKKFFLEQTGKLLSPLSDEELVVLRDLYRKMATVNPEPNN